MATKQTTYNISTKKNETSRAVETVLTVEWDTDEAGLIDLASKTVIIAAQRILRAVDGPIPARFAYKASEVGKRAAKVIIVEAKYEDMTLEQLQAARKKMELALAARKEPGVEELAGIEVEA